LQVSLLFGNLTEEDILLRGELDNLVVAHPDKLKVRNDKEWSKGRGSRQLQGTQGMAEGGISCNSWHRQDGQHDNWMWRC
jgi:hypothetical protein